MKSVLLVEDDNKLTLALGIRLKSMGYQVSTAADAIMAVSQARKNQPDVIIVDINLPGGDGFMVVNRLKSLHQTATTPIVMMTASKKPGLAEKARELGVMGYLEKPFDAGQLAEAIEQAVTGEGPFSDSLSA